MARSPVRAAGGAAGVGGAGAAGSASGAGIRAAGSAGRAGAAGISGAAAGGTWLGVRPSRAGASHQSAPASAQAPTNAASSSCNALIGRNASAGPKTELPAPVQGPAASEAVGSGQLT